MNDDDASGTRGLEITITAEGHRRLCELYKNLPKTSDITHCIGCSAPPVSGGDPPWRADGFDNWLTGHAMLHEHHLVLSGFAGRRLADRQRGHRGDDEANDHLCKVCRLRGGHSSACTVHGAACSRPPSRGAA